MAEQKMSFRNASVCVKVGIIHFTAIVHPESFFQWFLSLCLFLNRIPHRRIASIQACSRSLFSFIYAIYEKSGFHSKCCFFLHLITHFLTNHAPSAMPGPRDCQPKEWEKSWRRGRKQRIRNVIVLYARGFGCSFSTFGLGSGKNLSTHGRRQHATFEQMNAS